MAKSKKQLADEAWLRLNGQMELIDNKEPEVRYYGELYRKLPEKCPSCAINTAPSSIRKAGSWTALRTGMKENEALMQCCACAKIIRVELDIWRTVALRSNRAFTDNPTAPRRDAGLKRERGAG